MALHVNELLSELLCFLCPGMLFVKGFSFIGLHTLLTLAAVLTVEMSSHKNSSSTLLSGALAPQPVDLAIVVHLVVLQHSQFNLAVLVLDFLRCSVILLLTLLRTTPEPKHKMQGALFLNVVVTQSTPILKLLTSKDK